MKARFFLAAAFLFLGAAVKAQSDTATVNDEELKRYAVMMDSIDEMRIALLEKISDMVKNNENLSVARYNDLSKIIGDEEKLKEANATPEEIAAVKAVQTLKDTGTEEINTAAREIAKQYVGAATYNKVRKALKADAGVKSRYEAMLNELKADNGG